MESTPNAYNQCFLSSYVSLLLDANDALWIYIFALIKKAENKYNE